MKAADCPDPLAAAKEVLLRLLARREHSRRELQQKLKVRGYEQAVITQIVDAFADEDLQSDQRFTEAFVRDRVQRQQGPLKIQAELQHKGIPRNLIHRALEPMEEDWSVLARDFILRRNLGQLLDNIKGRQKVYNRLGRRGFTHSQAMGAIKSVNSTQKDR